MARAALRPVAHEDRLSLVEHLDELRTRIIIGLAVFLVCFGVAFWQNDLVLEIMNRPLEKTAFNKGSDDPFERAASVPAAQKRFYLQQAALARALAAREAAERRARRMLERARRAAAAAAAAAPNAHRRGAR